MLRKVNAQGLMDLIKANEEAPYFNLGSWYHPCGTFGCLVGNYAIATERKGGMQWTSEFKEQFANYYHVAELLGISKAESLFLFSPYEFHRRGDGGGFNMIEGKPIQNLNAERPELDCEQSLARVRKFLYYKLRKWELLYEEDGRVKESARTTEGDRMVCRDVLAAV